MLLPFAETWCDFRYGYTCARIKETLNEQHRSNNLF